MRRDPWKHRERYLSWKSETANGIEGVSPESSLLIRRFLADMEVGRNTAAGSRKGSRSYCRLNNLKQRLVFLTRTFEERFGLAVLTEVTEEQLHDYFGGMRLGTVRRLDGKPYRSTGDYVNVFKSFWHWYMKVERKAGRTVPELCEDLDYQSKRAPWVYLNLEDVRKLCRQAKFEYRVLMMFLFDTGMRSPTELLNVTVADLDAGCKKLRISAEASKTFGRTINLMLSSELIAEWISVKQLKPSDYLFSFKPKMANRYLKRLAGRVLGTEASRGGESYDRLTAYDFRHSSACYWLPLYKSESALKYRFGWKRSSMIEYYTGFIGMRDTITEDDLLSGNQRTELEQRLAGTEREKQLLEERLEAMDEQVKRILGAVDRLEERTA